MESPPAVDVTSQTRSVERGESFEVEGHPRWKISQLGGKSNTLQSSLSAFQTSFSLHDDDKDTLSSPTHEFSFNDKGDDFHALYMSATASNSSCQSDDAFSETDMETAERVHKELTSSGADNITSTTAFTTSVEQNVNRELSYADRLTHQHVLTLDGKHRLAVDDSDSAAESRNHDSSRESAEFVTVTTELHNEPPFLEHTDSSRAPREEVDSDSSSDVEDFENISNDSDYKFMTSSKDSDPQSGMNEKDLCTELAEISSFNSDFYRQQDADTVSEVSASKREFPGPSVERGESFEAIPPTKLRRQMRFGDSFNSGEFQTTLNYNKLESASDVECLPGEELPFQDFTHNQGHFGFVIDSDETMSDLRKLPSASEVSGTLSLTLNDFPICESSIVGSSPLDGQLCSLTAESNIAESDDLPSQTKLSRLPSVDRDELFEFSPSVKVKRIHLNKSSSSVGYLGGFRLGINASHEELEEKSDGQILSFTLPADADNTCKSSSRNLNDIPTYESHIVSMSDAPSETHPLAGKDLTFQGSQPSTPEEVVTHFTANQDDLISGLKCEVDSGSSSGTEEFENITDELEYKFRKSSEDAQTEVMSDAQTEAIMGEKNFDTELAKVSAVSLKFEKISDELEYKFRKSSDGSDVQTETIMGEKNFDTELAEISAVNAEVSLFGLYTTDALPAEDVSPLASSSSSSKRVFSAHSIERGESFEVIPPVKLCRQVGSGFSTSGFRTSLYETPEDIQTSTLPVVKESAISENLRSDFKDGTSEYKADSVSLFRALTSPYDQSGLTSNNGHLTDEYRITTVLGIVDEHAGEYTEKSSVTDDVNMHFKSEAEITLKHPINSHLFLHSTNESNDLVCYSAETGSTDSLIQANESVEKERQLVPKVIKDLGLTNGNQQTDPVLGESYCTWETYNAILEDQKSSEPFPSGSVLNRSDSLEELASEESSRAAKHGFSVSTSSSQASLDMAANEISVTALKEVSIQVNANASFLQNQLGPELNISLPCEYEKGQSSHFHEITMGTKAGSNEGSRKKKRITSETDSSESTSESETEIISDESEVNVSTSQPASMAAVYTSEVSKAPDELAKPLESLQGTSYLHSSEFLSPSFSATDGSLLQQANRNLLNNNLVMGFHEPNFSSLDSQYSNNTLYLQSEITPSESSPLQSEALHSYSNDQFQTSEHAITNQETLVQKSSSSPISQFQTLSSHDVPTYSSNLQLFLESDKTVLPHIFTRTQSEDIKNTLGGDKTANLLPRWHSCDHRSDIEDINYSQNPFTGEFVGNVSVLEGNESNPFLDENDENLSVEDKEEAEEAEVNPQLHRNPFLDDFADGVVTYEKLSVNRVTNTNPFLEYIDNNIPDNDMVSSSNDVIIDTNRTQSSDKKSNEYAIDTKISSEFLDENDASEIKDILSAPQLTYSGSAPAGITSTESWVVEKPKSLGLQCMISKEADSMMDVVHSEAESLHENVIRKKEQSPLWSPDSTADQQVSPSEEILEDPTYKSFGYPADESPIHEIQSPVDEALWSKPTSGNPQEDILDDVAKCNDPCDLLEEGVYETEIMKENVSKINQPAPRGRTWAGGDKECHAFNQIHDNVIHEPEDYLSHFADSNSALPWSVTNTGQKELAVKSGILEPEQDSDYLNLAEKEAAHSGLEKPPTTDDLVQGTNEDQTYDLTANNDSLSYPTDDSSIYTIEPPMEKQLWLEAELSPVQDKVLDEVTQNYVAGEELNDGVSEAEIKRECATKINPFLPWLTTWTMQDVEPGLIQQAFDKVPPGHMIGDEVADIPINREPIICPTVGSSSYENQPPIVEDPWVTSESCNLLNKPLKEAMQNDVTDEELNDGVFEDEIRKEIVTKLNPFLLWHTWTTQDKESDLQQTPDSIVSEPDDYQQRYIADSSVSRWDTTNKHHKDNSISPWDITNESQPGYSVTPWNTANEIQHENDASSWDLASKDQADNKVILFDTASDNQTNSIEDTTGKAQTDNSVVSSYDTTGKDQTNDSVSPWVTTGKDFTDNNAVSPWDTRDKDWTDKNVELWATKGGDQTENYTSLWGTTQTDQRYNNISEKNHMDNNSSSWDKTGKDSTVYNISPLERAGEDQADITLTPWNTISNDSPGEVLVSQDILRSDEDSSSHPSIENGEMHLSPDKLTTVDDYISEVADDYTDNLAADRDELIYSADESTRFEYPSLRTDKFQKEKATSYFAEEEFDADVDKAEIVKENVSKECQSIPYDSKRIYQHSEQDYLYKAPDNKAEKPDKFLHNFTLDNNESALDVIGMEQTRDITVEQRTFRSDESVCATSTTSNEDQTALEAANRSDDHLFDSADNQGEYLEVRQETLRSPACEFKWGDSETSWLPSKTLDKVMQSYDVPNEPSDNGISEPDIVKESVTKINQSLQWTTENSGSEVFHHISHTVSEKEDNPQHYIEIITSPQDIKGMNQTEDLTMIPHGDSYSLMYTEQDSQFKPDKLDALAEYVTKSDDDQAEEESFKVSKENMSSQLFMEADEVSSLLHTSTPFDKNVLDTEDKWMVSMETDKSLDEDNEEFMEIESESSINIEYESEVNKAVSVARTNQEPIDYLRTEKDDLSEQQDRTQDMQSLRRSCPDLASQTLGDEKDDQAKPGRRMVSRSFDLPQWSGEATYDDSLQSVKQTRQDESDNIYITDLPDKTDIHSEVTGVVFQPGSHADTGETAFAESFQKGGDEEIVANYDATNWPENIINQEMMSRQKKEESDKGRHAIDVWTLNSNSEISDKKVNALDDNAWYMNMQEEKSSLISQNPHISETLDLGHCPQKFDDSCFSTMEHMLSAEELNTIPTHAKVKSDDMHFSDNVLQSQYASDEHQKQLVLDNLDTHIQQQKNPSLSHTSPVEREAFQIIHTLAELTKLACHADEPATISDTDADVFSTEYIEQSGDHPLALSFSSRIVSFSRENTVESDEEDDDADANTDINEHAQESEEACQNSQQNDDSKQSSKNRTNEDYADINVLAEEANMWEMKQEITHISLEPNENACQHEHIKPCFINDSKTLSRDKLSSNDEEMFIISPSAGHEEQAATSKAISLETNMQSLSNRPSSPSWLDKVVTSAKNAYNSLGKRMKRKSRKVKNVHDSETVPSTMQAKRDSDSSSGESESDNDSYSDYSDNEADNDITGVKDPDTSDYAVRFPGSMHASEISDSVHPATHTDTQTRIISESLHDNEGLSAEHAFRSHLAVKGAAFHHMDQYEPIVAEKSVGAFLQANSLEEPKCEGFTETQTQVPPNSAAGSETCTEVDAQWVYNNNDALVPQDTYEEKIFDDNVDEGDDDVFQGSKHSNTDSSSECSSSSSSAFIPTDRLEPEMSHIRPFIGSTDVLVDSSSERRLSFQSAGSHSDESAGSPLPSWECNLDDYQKITSVEQNKNIQDELSSALQVDNELTGSSYVVHEGYEGFVSQLSSNRKNLSQRQHFIAGKRLGSTSSSEDNEEANSQPAIGKRVPNPEMKLTLVSDALQGYDADKDEWTSPENATPSKDLTVWQEQQCVDDKQVYIEPSALDVSWETSRMIAVNTDNPEALEVELSSSPSSIFQEHKVSAKVITKSNSGIEGIDANAESEELEFSLTSLPMEKFPQLPTKMEKTTEPFERADADTASYVQTKHPEHFMENESEPVGAFFSMHAKDISSLPATLGSHTFIQASKLESVEYPEYMETGQASLNYSDLQDSLGYFELVPTSLDSEMQTGENVLQDEVECDDATSDFADAAHHITDHRALHLPNVEPQNSITMQLSLDQGLARRSVDSLSIGASFSSSIESLTLVAFENQAAAEIEDAAERNFKSIDECESRSVSSLDVIPSRQIYSDDVFASPDQEQKDFISQQENELYQEKYGVVVDRQNSPSWMDKALAKARHAYESVEERLKRRLSKKQRKETNSSVSTHSTDDDMSENEMEEENTEFLSEDQNDETSDNFSCTNQRIIIKQNRVHSDTVEDTEASLDTITSFSGADIQSSTAKTLQRSFAFSTEPDFDFSMKSPLVSGNTNYDNKEAVTKTDIENADISFTDYGKGHTTDAPLSEYLADDAHKDKFLKSDSETAQDNTESSFWMEKTHFKTSDERDTIQSQLKWNSQNTEKKRPSVSSDSSGIELSDKDECLKKEAYIHEAEVNLFSKMETQGKNLDTALAHLSSDHMFDLVLPTSSEVSAKGAQSQDMDTIDFELPNIRHSDSETYSFVQSKNLANVSSENNSMPSKSAEITDYSSLLNDEEFEDKNSPIQIPLVSTHTERSEDSHSSFPSEDKAFQLFHEYNREGREASLSWSSVEATCSKQHYDDVPPDEELPAIEKQHPEGESIMYETQSTDTHAEHTGISLHSGSLPHLESGGLIPSPEQKQEEFHVIDEVEPRRSKFTETSVDSSRSLSWTDKAINKARHAYDSIGRRLKRKSNKNRKSAQRSESSSLSAHSSEDESSGEYTYTSYDTISSDINDMTLFSELEFQERDYESAAFSPSSDQWTEDERHQQRDAETGDVTAAVSELTLLSQDEIAEKQIISTKSTESAEEHFLESTQEENQSQPVCSSNDILPSYGHNAGFVLDTEENLSEQSTDILEASNVNGLQYFRSSEAGQRVSVGSGKLSLELHNMGSTKLVNSENASLEFLQQHLQELPEDKFSEDVEMLMNISSTSNMVSKEPTKLSSEVDNLKESDSYPSQHIFTSDIHKITENSVTTDRSHRAPESDDALLYTSGILQSITENRSNTVMSLDFAEDKMHWQTASSTHMELPRQHNRSDITVDASNWLTPSPEELQLNLAEGKSAFSLDDFQSTVVNKLNEDVELASDSKSLLTSDNEIFTTKHKNEHIAQSVFQTEDYCFANTTDDSLTEDTAAANQLIKTIPSDSTSESQDVRNIHQYSSDTGHSFISGLPSSKLQVEMLHPLLSSRIGSADTEQNSVQLPIESFTPQENILSTKIFSQAEHIVRDKTSDQLLSLEAEVASVSSIYAASELVNTDVKGSKWETNETEHCIQDNSSTEHEMQLLQNVSGISLQTERPAPVWSSSELTEGEMYEKTKAFLRPESEFNDDIIPSSVIHLAHQPNQVWFSSSENEQRLLQGSDNVALPRHHSGAFSSASLERECMLSQGTYVQPPNSYFESDSEKSSDISGQELSNPILDMTHPYETDSSTLELSISASTAHGVCAELLPSFSSSNNGSTQIEQTSAQLSNRSSIPPEEILSESIFSQAEHFVRNQKYDPLMTSETHIASSSRTVYPTSELVYTDERDSRWEEDENVLPIKDNLSADHEMRLLQNVSDISLQTGYPVSVLSSKEVTEGASYEKWRTFYSLETEGSGGHMSASDVHLAQQPDQTWFSSSENEQHFLQGSDNVTLHRHHSGGFSSSSPESKFVLSHGTHSQPPISHFQSEPEKNSDKSDQDFSSPTFDTECTFDANAATLELSTSENTAREICAEPLSSFSSSRSGSSEKEQISVLMQNKFSAPQDDILSAKIFNQAEDFVRNKNSDQVVSPVTQVASVSSVYAASELIYTNDKSNDWETNETEYRIQDNSSTEHEMRLLQNVNGLSLQTGRQASAWSSTEITEGAKCEMGKAFFSPESEFNDDTVPSSDTRLAQQLDQTWFSSSENEQRLLQGSDNVTLLRHHSDGFSTASPESELVLSHETHSQPPVSHFESEPEKNSDKSGQELSKPIFDMTRAFDANAATLELSISSSTAREVCTESYRHSSSANDDIQRVKDSEKEKKLQLQGSRQSFIGDDTHMISFSSEMRIENSDRQPSSEIWENFEQDSKPLIVDEVAENSADDFIKVDQENIDPTKMPFELFKRKKNKEKVITEDPILGHKDNDEVTKKDELIAVGGKGNHTVDDRVVVANDVQKSPEKEEPKKEDAPSTGENAQVAIPAKNQDASPAKGREGEPEATAEGAAAAEPSKSEKGSLLIDQAPAGTVCCTIL